MLNFNLFNSILFAGILQGFIFAFIVLTNKKYKKRSTYYLAALIISFSLNNLQYYISDVGFVSNDAFYRYIYNPWCLIIPVFIYLYNYNSLYPEKKIAFQQKLLFLPFLVGLFVSTSYKILRAFDYENDTFYGIIYYCPTLFELIAISLTLFILTALFLKIIAFEKQNSSFSTDGLQIKLNWLKQILFYLFILTLVWLYLMILILSTATKVNFYPVWIGLSIITYWSGYVGIYKYGVIEERKKIKKTSLESNNSFTISDRQKNEHIVSFEHLIVDQKRFLDTNLTLDKIADELHLSKSHLSRIINSELQIGFTDYVNSLRVQEAKNHLLNPDFSNYTLEAIGLEAGFNSKSAFYSSFKKITGLTPSEFKKETANLS
ncbi:helix-turn-helix domain-containing protein [Flavobacterium sp. 25HG05S-40]|uniref:helix-turn-helix domain-containing protein n=1 Tax=Flavobacterium sp. 25HG05S-40 TaxID=3458682 RepID=UPI004043E3FC